MIKSINNSLRYCAETLITQTVLHQIFLFSSFSQSAEAGREFNEYHQYVQHHQGGLNHSRDHPQNSDKSQISCFWRNHFFLFWESFKLFWPPRTYFGKKNLTFEGVILLKLLDPSCTFGDFLGCLCQKIVIFNKIDFIKKTLWFVLPLGVVKGVAPATLTVLDLLV